MVDKLLDRIRSHQETLVQQLLGDNNLPSATVEKLRIQHITLQMVLNTINELQSEQPDPTSENPKPKGRKRKTSASAK